MATFFRLLAQHGSAEAALEALPGVARAAGARDYLPCPREAAEAEYDAGQRLGARLVAFGKPDYPAALAEIADPPPLLWALGDTGLLGRPSVALVGARNASSLGMRMARALSRDLGAAGYCIVSGLARGIDAEAHRAALATGTVAVQAGGIDIVYPAENAALAAEIAATGLRISEQPVGLEPQARHFPRRNRLVSGLSRAIVVVEAAARSGSLITARTALEQGREVFAVPGHPFDARASGCNLLIRDGAPLVRGAQDVLDALAPAGPPRSVAERRGPAGCEPQDTAEEATPVRTSSGTSADRGAAILALVGVSPVAEDQIGRDLGLSAQEVSAEILALELEGRIERRAGGMLARCA